MNNNYGFSAEIFKTPAEKIKYRLNLVERKPHWSHIEKFLINVVDNSDLPVPGIQVAPDEIVEAYWFWVEKNIQIQLHFHPIDWYIEPADTEIINLRVFAPNFKSEVWARLGMEDLGVYTTARRRFNYSQHQKVRKIISEIYSYVI